MLGLEENRSDCEPDDTVSTFTDNILNVILLGNVEGYLPRVSLVGSARHAFLSLAPLYCSNLGIVRRMGDLGTTESQVEDYELFPSLAIC